MPTFINFEQIAEATYGPPCLVDGDIEGVAMYATLLITTIAGRQYELSGDAAEAAWKQIVSHRGPGLVVD